jgi:4-hydroxybenzoate polyprenyltransferase
VNPAVASWKTPAEHARTFASMVVLAHTVFAMPFAAAAVVLSLERPHVSLTIGRAIAMMGCMVTARTAAMAFNRYLDRTIDAINPRTKNRELPRGAVSPNAALTIAIASSLLFIGLAATLGRATCVLSLPVLAVVLGYSYTKRFTWASHLVLGLALALAPGGAWIAMGTQIEPSILSLMLAVITWVAGFDIIYSLQDEQFDRTHGLYSIPVRFGAKGAAIASALLHVTTTAALLSTGIWLDRGTAYFIGVALITALLVYEHALIGFGRTTHVNKAFFDVNGYVSVGFFALTLLDTLLGPR